MAMRARNKKMNTRRTDLRESDNRFTPVSFLQAVEHGFGEIDFDPCWHVDCQVRPLAYFDVRQGDDGLRDPWFGNVVFVNPPWSNQKKWVERAHSQWSCGNVKTVVCLVPAKTDTDLFHDILSRDADVYFIRGRPKFFREDGSSESTMVSTMAVIFGATDKQKRRFAQKVLGSWWQSPPRSSASAVSMPMSVCTKLRVYEYPPMSCVSGCQDLRVHCRHHSG
ncbi:DNA N-6-adenine-methyltransferase [Novosphingopyxis sp.]|uniref:DNA N-6-adenine-methyltransferase n=1 Tax=Novosphingopyxis sp. TaxID=2709690 RepID=UPI003B5AFF56